MANGNPLDEFSAELPETGSEPGPEAEDSTVDQQVDGLRSVMKKNTGELPVVSEEADDMGGANALGQDFGADFAADTDGSATGLNDPFGLDDMPAGDFSAAGGLGSDFGADLASGGSDFGTAATAAAAAGKLGPSGEATRVDVVLDIPVDVQIILGNSRMSVSSLMELSEGATIALDRKIGEPVDITVNGKLMGRGEITVLENDDTRFGVRMIEVYGTPAKKA